MADQLFLSHDARDRAQADIVAGAIGRISLGQITVWHSSDGSAGGGIQPGQVWLDAIRARLRASKAVVVLLTPGSVERPWIFFESGYGAALDGCDVVPVCIGIDSNTQVPFPLAMYQTFQLSDYESAVRFAAKLLARYGVRFDEEMARPVLQDAVRQLSQAGTGTALAAPAAAPTIADAVQDLKAHIDRRLLAVLGPPGDAPDGPQARYRYSVQVELNLDPDRPTRQHLEIDPAQSVQDVLDNVYFMLEGKVQARTYLEEWLLRDTGTREHLVIREIQTRVPAQAVFAPGTSWEVVFLPQPYSAKDRLRSFPARPRAR